MNRIGFPFLFYGIVVKQNKLNNYTMKKKNYKNLIFIKKNSKLIKCRAYLIVMTACS